MTLGGMDRAALAGQQMAQLAPVMPGGWIKSLRTALSMPRKALSLKLGRDPRAISRLETRERSGSITLTELADAAAAMDSVLVYAIVPREVPSKTLESMAEVVARKDIARVIQSMYLDAGSITKSAREDLVMHHKMRLMQRPELLWR